jgi:hypothetical protein
MRNKDIKDYHSGIGDIAGFMRSFPKINFRYFLSPSENIGGSGLGMLDFSNTTSTWPMQMVGRTDGENAVKAGEGFMSNKLLEWEESEDL